jgi:hypothetical protein
MIGASTHYHNNHVITISMLKPKILLRNTGYFCSEHVSCLIMSAKINSMPCLDTSDLFLVLSHLKSLITMKLKEFNFYINFRIKGVNAEVHISKSIFQHSKCQSVSV